MLELYITITEGQTSRRPKAESVSCRWHVKHPADHHSFNGWVETRHNDPFFILFSCFYFYFFSSQVRARSRTAIVLPDPESGALVYGAARRRTLGLASFSHWSTAVVTQRRSEQLPLPRDQLLATALPGGGKSRRPSARGPSRWRTAAGSRCARECCPLRAEEVCKVSDARKLMRACVRA